MLWNFQKNFLVVNPVFKHLTWHFDEISFDLSPRKFAEIGFTTHAMHYMPKFVEKGWNFWMTQKWGFLLSWSSNVGNHCDCRCSQLPINHGSLDKGEHSRMIVFIRSRMQIKIKMTQNLISLYIFDLIMWHIRMPHRSSILTLQPLKLNPKQFGVNLHRLFFNML